jgi:flavin-dependent dehydrogenase
MTSDDQYDAIIVGARCAGSPTAMLLARKGYKVLLLDRASFPSDTISSHVIWPTGVFRLEKWNLLDRVVATGCPPMANPIMFDFGPIAIKGCPTAYNGVRDSYAPRRTVLDKILVDAAVEAGAQLRENFTVDELTFENGRATGIRGHGRPGAEVRERARIVIGADGLHSVVAKATNAAMYNERPKLGCFYFTYWSGIQSEGMEAYIRPRRAVLGIPTIDGLTLVLTAWPVSEFDAFRSDVEGNYLKTLDVAPEFAARVRQGRREERLVGTGDVPNFFRKPFGDGWALVGDAGYHKDPTTAQGISDAFRDADALTDAIDSGFSGRRPLGDALAEYESKRNETVGALYEFTQQLANLEEPPSPELQHLLGAISTNQQASDQFFGVNAGTVPVPEFFAPENVQRIMGAASAPRSA